MRCDAMRCDSPNQRRAQPPGGRCDRAVPCRCGQLSVGPTGRAYLVDAVEERDEVRDVDAREALVQLKLRALSAVCCPLSVARCLRHVVCRALYVVCCTLSAAESRQLQQRPRRSTLPRRTRPRVLRALLTYPPEDGHSIQKTVRARVPAQMWPDRRRLRVRATKGLTAQ
jgi:hypothetical protein